MKVTVAEFTYDKQDGSTPKDRKILVLSKPSDTFFGVEFDEIEDVANLLDYLAEKEKLDELLKARYDINETTLKYKRFKVAKIQNLNESKIVI